jgi:cell division protease FtsH
MIKTIINEALIQAHNKGREFLTYKDWLDAADERTMGLKQPIRSWNLDDRQKTAYHEAGHAIVQRYLRPHERNTKATHALGFVQPAAIEERTSLFARWIETRIMVSLGGHVIEDRFLDSLSTGPASDLENATYWAQMYVARFAMGPTKIIVPMQPGQPPIGPVITAAHELLDQLYEETERLLREKEAAVHHLAKALIEKLELIGDELEEVMVEVETAHPDLKKPFQRKIIQFREFAPPREPSADAPWKPPALEEGVQQPAARGGVTVDPASRDGWGRPPATGTWLGSI